MFNNWEVAFVFLFPPVSQLFSDSEWLIFSLSVFTKPTGESQQAPGPPHLAGLRCSPRGSTRMVSVEILPRPQTPSTVSGQPAVPTFLSSSRCLLMTSSPESLRFAALVQHMSWALVLQESFMTNVLNFLFFFFFNIMNSIEPYVSIQKWHRLKSIIHNTVIWRELRDRSCVRAWL